ncbi:MAG: hypothetical protein U5L75_01370 [Candidatus Campbellbacteria bacterium]|nr:hypothetical protein [Candidatus Campbellbacteria bacterium]
MERDRCFVCNADSRIQVITTGRSRLSCELLPGNGYVHEVVFLRDPFGRQRERRFIDLSVYHEIEGIPEFE